MTATNKKYTILVLLFLSLFLFFPIRPTVAVDTDLNNQVEEEEEARKDALRTFLGLDLPIETDNPNFQIEFTEPEDTDVQIKIDSGDYSAKKSPYTLPSVSIGRHVITFKFEDADGVEQTLAEVLIVLPRSPIFSESEELNFDTPAEVSFAGTALPNSTVVFLISSDLTMEIVTADSDGNWSMSVSEELAEGSHQIVGFVRKDGYASDFSDPITFYVGTGTDTSLDVGGTEKSFDLNLNINWGDIFSEKNKYYFIGAGGLVLLLLIVFIGQSYRSNMTNGKDIEKLNNGKKEEKHMSLREKLTAEKKEPVSPAESRGEPSLSMQSRADGKPEGNASAGSAQGIKEKNVEENVKDEPLKEEVVAEKKEEEPDPEKEIVEELAKLNIGKETEEEVKAGKAIDKSVTLPKAAPEEKVGSPKKGLFSFLGFGKNSATPEATPKLNSDGDIKKVVTKDEFLEDFKDGSSSHKPGTVHDLEKLNRKEKINKDETIQKTSEKQIVPKGKAKKSNTIEVTLG